jgi:hypothetical protein
VIRNAGKGFREKPWKRSSIRTLYRPDQSEILFWKVECLSSYRTVDPSVYQILKMHSYFAGFLIVWFWVHVQAQRLGHVWERAQTLESPPDCSVSAFATFGLEEITDSMVIL